MEFGLSEEQTQLQDTVNRYLDDASTLDAVRGFRERPGRRRLARPGGARSVRGILVAETSGGLGLGALDAATGGGGHRFAYRSRAFPRISGDGADGTQPRWRQSRRPARRARCRRPPRWACALGEAIGARQKAGIRSSGANLSGTSLFVADFGASHYLVADDKRAAVPGCGRRRRHYRRALTTIDRTRRTGELIFEKTPALRLTDDPAVLQRVLDFGRVMLAADTLGAAQNMLDQAVAYAKEREQFNRPIGSFQAVKHMCAEMAASLEPCRALVWYAAHAQDEVPGEATLMACHAKAHLAEVGTFVARTATEVHGGMGFTDLLGLHYWFKRIGLNRQMLGAPELVREEAARAQQLVT